MIPRKEPPEKPSSRKQRKRNKDRFRYNEDFIVKALWEMQHEKCCYCEMKIPLKGHAKAVEHFVPKSKVKEFTNDWNNLLLACAQCNGKKSDKFPLELFVTKYDDDKANGKVIYLCKKKDLTKGSPLLINPSKEDPEKYLDFICGMEKDDYGLIKSKANKRKGKYTIKTIGLYDPHYTNEHRDYIRLLHEHYSQLTHAVDNKDHDWITAKIQFFNQRLRANYKLAGLARAFVKHYNFIKFEKYGFQVPSE